MKVHGFVVQGALVLALLAGTHGGASAERLALVIGNNDYAHVSRLQKALGDARAMKQALERLGFTVTLLENADFKRFGEALDTFEAKVSRGDEVVVHYSGHGVSMGGRNYLLPTDIEEPQPGQERRLQRWAYEAGDVIETIRAKGPRYVFAILDACRNNPFTGAGRSIGLTRGLARIEAEPGAFILSSAGPGETALDRLANDDRSETSVFTRVLLKQLETPGTTLQGIAKATQRQVRDLALTVNHRQFPDYSDRTTDELVLVPGAPAVPAPKPGGRTEQARADTAYRLAMLDGSDAALKEVLGRFPDHPRAKEALDLLEARADDAAFAKAKEAGTVEAYEAYLKRPGARRANEARTAIARLTPPKRPAVTGPAASLSPLQLLAGPADAQMHAAAFSPDGRFVATEVRQGGSIKLWDAGTGRLLRSFEERAGEVYALAFSPDGRMVVSGGQDQSVRLWEVATGRLLRILQGTDGPVRSVAFSPDGRRVASVDSKVRLWNASTGELVRTLAGISPARPVTIAFSPDGRMLASGGRDDIVRLWDTDTGEVLHHLEGHASDIAMVVFSPDGRTLVSQAENNFVKVWDAETGALLHTYADLGVSLAISPDGRWLASGSGRTAVRLWDVGTGKPLRALQEVGSHRLGSSIAFSADGRALMSSAHPASVWLWEIASGRAVAKLLPLPDGEWAAASEKGYIASAGAHRHLQVLQAGYRLPVDDQFRQRWLKENLPGIAAAAP